MLKVLGGSSVEAQKSLSQRCERGPRTSAKQVALVQQTFLDFHTRAPNRDGKKGSFGEDIFSKISNF